MQGASFTHPVLASFFIWGVSLTHPVLDFLIIIFFLHFFVCYYFILFFSSFLFFLFFIFNFLSREFMENFSYTSYAGFVFIWGLSLTHPVLVLFLCREFLLHIPCCLHFCAGEFLSHIPCCLQFYAGSLSYTSHGAIIFIWGVSLTHPVLASFLSAGSLLHIPC